MTPLGKVSWLPGWATILAIPACYGTTLVVVFLSLLGISIAVNEHVWAGAISVFATLATIGVATSYRWHGSIWPTAITALGMVLILWAMYGSYSRATELDGFLLLIAGTLLDLRMRRMSRSTATGVSWIEPGDLSERLGRNAGPVVVDVRSVDEFTGPLGHIPDARNVPVGELASRVYELAVLKDKGVVLVCRTDRRSAAASSVLRKAGLQNVQVLRGGMERWNRDGRTIARHPLQPAPWSEP